MVYVLTKSLLRIESKNHIWNTVYSAAPALTPNQGIQYRDPPHLPKLHRFTPTPLPPHPRPENCLQTNFHEATLGDFRLPVIRNIRSAVRLSHSWFSEPVLAPGFPAKSPSHPGKSRRVWGRPPGEPSQTPNFLLKSTKTYQA